MLFRSQYPALVVGVGYICTRPWKKNEASLEIVCSSVLSPKELRLQVLSTAPQGNAFLFGAKSIEQVADTSTEVAIARNKKPVVNARRPSSFGGSSKNFGAQFGAQKSDLQPVPTVFKRVGSC